MVITQQISYFLVYCKGSWVWRCPLNENEKGKEKNERQDKSIAGRKFISELNAKVVPGGMPGFPLSSPFAPGLDNNENKNLTITRVSKVM